MALMSSGNSFRIKWGGFHSKGYGKLALRMVHKNLEEQGWGPGLSPVAVGSRVRRKSKGIFCFSGAPFGSKWYPFLWSVLSQY